MEEKIYLYTELTSSEKKRVDEHITQCVACSVLAQQLFHSQEIIKNAANHKPELRNPQALTQRIMNAVENEKSRSIFSVLTDFMDNLFVRYAISAMAVFLISFYVYEQQGVDFSTSMNKTYQSEISQGAVLDYSKFRNTYVRRRDNKSTVVLSSRYSYYKSERIEKK
jgi:predicted anti-sigma-YlaC factor YlaD